MSVERVECKDGSVVWRVRWRQGGRNRSKALGRKRDADAFDAELVRKKRTGELAQHDDEMWVAIGTHAADGRFVDERLRDVLFRLVFDAAEAELWEPRADWPTGELAWFEVARLGVRGPD
jgi:hypothetical protein